MQIGPYKLPGRFVLAPMAGITDAPFRRLCRRFGAALTTSEMTTADTRLWQSPKSRFRLNLDMDTEPCVVQIAGADPAQMAEAARACVARGAQIVDINMGCPAKKVCSKLAGSALLQNEELVQRILDGVVAAVDVPVTLKIRTGWSPERRNGVRIAELAQQAGIQSLAVHGRTRACRFKGEAEYATIAAIKRAVKIPVIANGDITDSEKSLEVLRLSGADALMIGRGAQGRPWIFQQLNNLFHNEKRVVRLDKKQVRDIMLGHLSDLYRFYGDETGVRVARKHLVWYCNGLADSAEFRSQVVRVDSAAAQTDLVNAFFRRQSNNELLAA
ncbi:MAG: tRNA dihydrouridine synthase DusB [Woeseia sp.]|nr:tRNA dihydrouridine synthase DusB [Woeseia sp.]